MHIFRQIIIAFMFSAWSTLFLVFIYYLFNIQATENSIDRALVNFLTNQLRKRCAIQVSDKWIKAIEGAVLTCSDTQVITGLAILLCGYIQVSKLSAYHWQIVVNLAWFSSLTHLTTLTFLRHRLRQQRDMAISRAVLMGTIVLLLAVSLGPAGFSLQDSNSYEEQDSYQINAIPAICLFHESSVRLVEESLELHTETSIVYNIPTVVLSITYLVISYLTRVVRIFKPTSEFTQIWVRAKPSMSIKAAYGYTEKKSNEGSRSIFLIWRVPMVLLLLNYVALKAVYEMASSMIWEVRPAAPLLSCL